jgi:lariat debranching enzyme
MGIVRYYGGFVAPNIYFLGFAGVVQFGGIRIGGLSGIYKDHDFHKGHFERAPYNKDNIKSVYHVRQYDVLKLMEVRGAIDIFVSHDWPRGITKYGDAQQLLRQKPHFQQDVWIPNLVNIFPFLFFDAYCLLFLH